MLLPWL